MLARVTEFDGDVDKLVAEYQQDIGIESGQPGQCNQELKDCVEVPRVSRRVPRQESLRVWHRVQVCLRESLRGRIRERYSSVSARKAKTMCHGSGNSVEC